MQIMRWVYDRADRLKGGHSTGREDYYKVDRLRAAFKLQGKHNGVKRFQARYITRQAYYRVGRLQGWEITG